MMNDPHVEALIYRIEHDDSIDYSNASPVSWDEDEFRVSIEDLEVRFDLHEHHATVEGAIAAIKEYIRVWDFSAQLEHGPEAFSLRFAKPVVVDRNPDPIVGNTMPLAVAVYGGCPTVSAQLTVTSKPNSYPSPPANLELSPDAESMHHRYMGYRRNSEPLPSMAYFCLSLLENLSAGEGSKERKRPKRKVAAQIFHVDKRVLDEVGRLSSTHGGPEARKSEGTTKPLSLPERRFLEEAIRRLIRRVAERAATPKGDLEQIRLSDLPSLPEHPR